MSRPTILMPYRTDRAGRRIRPWSLGFMLLYSAATGVGIAILPAQLLFLLAIPLILSVGVILWLLPDGTPVPVRWLQMLMVWFIGITVLWPNYISVDLPGLPWINPPRLVIFALLALGLWSYSTSSALRTEVSETLGGISWLRWAFWIFWATTLITIPLSQQPGFSLNKWVNNQIYWTFMFVVAAYVGQTPGTMTRIFRVLVWTTILVACETLYEFRTQQVPWMNHIPSFMTVDAAYLTNVLKSQARSGTDIYRARGTFTTSLVLAEHLAMVYPFLIHAAITSRALWQKALLGLAMIATVSAMWVTNSRSAMIGFFLSVFLYGGFAVYRTWRREKQSLLTVSTLAMLPLMAMVFLALSLTWPRLHNMTFGGAQHQPSTEARNAQWAIGMPKVLRNPVGHGAAMSGQVLGYANGAGQLTIDTEYLSLLLDYGVIGFAAFFTLFAGQLWPGLRLYLSAAPGEETFTGPITISLLNFLVIKAVSSGELLVPMAFMLLGFLFAVTRCRQRAAGATVPPAATATTGLAVRPAYA